MENEMANEVERYPGMSLETKARCLEFARLADELKKEAGGTAFQIDLLLVTASKAGMVVVDKVEYEKLVRSGNPS